MTPTLRATGSMQIVRSGAAVGTIAPSTIRIATKTYQTTTESLYAVNQAAVNCPREVIRIAAETSTKTEAFWKPSAETITVSGSIRVLSLKSVRKGFGTTTESSGVTKRAVYL